MIRLSYILIPFGILSFGAIYRGQNFTLIICSLAILGQLIKSWPLKIFIWYVCAWSLALCFGSVLGTITEERALEAYSAMLFILGGMACYVGAANLKTPLIKIHLIVCIGALIQSAIGFCQWFSYDPFLNLVRLKIDMRNILDPDAVTGTLGNQNHFGGYLAISLPFFFRAKWKWAAIPIGIHLATLYSTSAVSAAIAGVIIYFRKWSYLAIGAALLIFFVLFVENYPIIENPRWLFWKNVLRDQIFNNLFIFLLGAGPGAWTGYPFNLHNEWLEFWFYYGITGLAMAGIYIYQLDRSNRILYAAFMVACVNCLAAQPIHLGPSAFLILIIMGLLEREKYGGLSNIC